LWQEGELVLLVLEHCAGGDLSQILARHGGILSEEHVARRVVLPLLHALQARWSLCGSKRPLLRPT
jgi:hypothetical protein